VTDVPQAALFLQKTQINWGFVTERQNRSYFGDYDRRGLWASGEIINNKLNIHFLKSKK